jgi:hypothetical protein
MMKNPRYSQMPPGNDQSGARNQTADLIQHKEKRGFG